MIKVLCMRVGQKYSPDYVYRLKAMVEKHLTLPHEFYCITENPAQIPGVDYIPAPLEIADSWCKIGLFCPTIAKIKRGDLCLYLDLDVIVTGSLNRLVHKKCTREDDENLWIIKDFYQDPYNSSVMLWRHGKQGKIFGKFNGLEDMRRLRGDQNLIAEIVEDAKLFKEKDILSYKFSKGVGPNGYPEDTKIVVFHGKPKMADLEDVDWIKKEWFDIWPC